MVHMAEVTKERQVSHKSDVFSAGLVIASLVSFMQEHRNDIVY
jgi:hypothetical protein